MLWHSVCPDILTLNELEMLTEHYANKFGIGLGDSKAKKYDVNERAVIGELYERLRENGVYTSGLDRSGRLKFNVTIKSAVHAMLEAGLKAC